MLSFLYVCGGGITFIYLPEVKLFKTQFIKPCLTKIGEHVCDEDYLLSYTFIKDK